MSAGGSRGRIAALVASGMSMMDAIAATRAEWDEERKELEARMDRASETLKPCPFCGARAVVTNSYDGHGERINNEFMARCYDGCGCLLDNAAGSPQAAAEDWNVRKDCFPANESLAELCEYLAEKSKEHKIMASLTGYSPSGDTLAGWQAEWAETLDGWINQIKQIAPYSRHNAQDQTREQ